MVGSIMRNYSIRDALSLVGNVAVRKAAKYDAQVPTFPKCPG